MGSPKYNLLRDGHEAVAEHLSAYIRRNRGCHSVYIDPAGAVRIIPDHGGNQLHRKDSERIGRYRKGVLVEHLEDDLLAWQRETTGEQHGATA